MGFLDKIKNIFFGPDYEKKLSNLTNRISELNAQKRKADAELERLKKREIVIPNFEVKSISKMKLLEVKPFNPPKISQVRTMKDLMLKRKEEEAERRRQLRQQVEKNLYTVGNFIQDENPARAENLLFSTSSAVLELNDNQLSSLYDELLNKISLLKSELLKREILRREEERRCRAKEVALRLEQERIRKQREEVERLERERKAREYEEKLAREEQMRLLEIERLTAIVTWKKEDADSILQYLRMKNITRFYHFTDKENLYLIKKLGGLYSWDYCEKNDIVIPNPGGDPDSRRYDRKHGLEDYVRLSFCDDHPMAYRKHNEGSSLVLLYIDIEVAAFKETLFTDRNAASSTFACGGSMEDLQKVNIAATQRNYVSREEGEIFSQHQAECMIKTFVPLRYITNINNPRNMIFR